MLHYCVKMVVVLKWFKHKTSEKVMCPKYNDVISYFDNNQILAHNWRVRYNAKAMLSIITSVIHIELRIVTKFQTIPELDQHSWLYNNVTPICCVVDNINTFINVCYDKFKQLRDNFIIERLNKVYNEHIHENTVCSDVIDKLMNDDNFNVPPNPTNKDLYSSVDHHHPKKHLKLLLENHVFKTLVHTMQWTPYYEIC